MSSAGNAGTGLILNYIDHKNRDCIADTIAINYVPIDRDRQRANGSDQISRITGQEIGGGGRSARTWLYVIALHSLERQSKLYP